MTLEAELARLRKATTSPVIEEPENALTKRIVRED